jgi:CheY-like chemotaxis protein
MGFAFGRADYGRIETIPGAAVVLLVEDSPPDVYLFRAALNQHGITPQLLLAQDGDEAILLLDKIDRSQIACPDGIVLDLNLPKKTGFDVLRRVRLSPKCGHKPIVMLSSSDTARDRDTAARLGVTSYLRKPADLEEFIEIGGKLKSVLQPEPE